MSAKDITDAMVCQAYAETARQRRSGRVNNYEYPHDILARTTGECEKVCYRAMERAVKRGLIEYGVSLHAGWLTPKGEALAATTV